ncbi:hypothetical protein N9O88_01760, partial [bacterium]|nr:hypothetical protein [bacterium]
VIYDSVMILKTDLIKNKETKIQSNKDFEKKILDQVLIKLTKYITDLKPTDLVFIAFDGVAPCAKLHQQRTRRHKTNLEKKIFEQLNLPIDQFWNTSAITPGTEFMNKLDNFINKKLNNKNLGVKNIIVSGPNKPGEGEHKIFDYIRNNKEIKNKTNIVYGLDADLIMLSLNHLVHSNNLYLYRETPEFIKYIDKTLEPNKSYLLDIPMMGEKLIYELNIKNINHNEKHGLIKDYIFIFFMMGNDFLPHFPCLNIRTDGISYILDAYKLTLLKKGNLTNNNKIIWKNFQYFINLLSEQEERYFKLEHNKREKMALRIDKNSIEEKDRYLNLPLINRSKEIYINPNEEGWEKRYYNILFKLEKREDNVKKIVYNYLEGLEWTLKYYTTGCVDWEWYYKYNYPPLLNDIKPYVPYFDIEFLECKNNNPIDSQLQLAYVLPYDNIDLLNKNIQKKILGSVENTHNDINLEYSYCRYMWEAHIDGNFLNLKDLQKIIEK